MGKIIIILLFPFLSLAQTITVKSAKELRSALLGNSKLIKVNSNINLGELLITDFPLVVKPGVTIRGQFDLRKNLSTKITFPFAFTNGSPCNSRTDTYADIKGFAIEMQDGSIIENIRLEGPEKGIKDWRYYQYSACGKTYYPQEGISSGIIVTGVNCTIRKCEIWHFAYFGAEFVPDKKGDFHFYNNYIHDIPEQGYGYGLWVAQGRSTNLNCIDSCGKNTSDLPITAFIKYNIFHNNKHDVAASGGNINMVIESNSFLGGGNFNIDRHQASSTCAYGKYIQDVGGGDTEITKNKFLYYASNIGITYPNINCDKSYKINIYDNGFKYIHPPYLNIQIADNPDTNRWMGDTNIVIRNNTILKPDTFSISGLSTGIEMQNISFTASRNDISYIWNINGSIYKTQTVSYLFRKQGVYSVTVFGIYPNGMTTDIMTKEVVITGISSRQYLTFNIYDNFNGLKQSGCGNFILDDSIKSTGFIKYCLVNGKEVWADDIAGNEGWRTVTYLLKDTLKTLEIGIKATRQVNSDTVRGVAILVDDINYPGVKNGTFEKLKYGTNSQPDAWNIYSSPEKPFYTDCTGKEFNINQQGAFLSIQAAKSGKWGLYMIIRPLTMYGVNYNIGKYHSVLQIK